VDRRIWELSTNLSTLTPNDVARILRLTPRTVYEYLRAGKLPGRKIGGGRWRVLERDLEAFLRGEDARERLVDEALVEIAEERERAGEKTVPWEHARAARGL
jgi:excisionase family DNA binding protein